MSAVEIEGFCAPRLGAVKDAFRDNFVDDDELGTACVIVDGRDGVDLWGGCARPRDSSAGSGHDRRVAVRVKAPEYRGELVLVSI
jgi:hypothetical protein